MFTMFPSIFGIVFVIILSIFVITIFKGIAEWHSNNQQPILTEKAVIVSKRGHTSRHAHNHNGHVHHSSSTTYYVTFEFENRDRLELKVPRNKFGYLVEGDFGDLTYQGTRYHDFVRVV